MSFLDTSETNRVMEILENLEDEQLAVELLKEFNDKTKALGVLLMNKDKELNNVDWKNRCDKAKEDVDNVLKRIFSIGDQNG